MRVSPLVLTICIPVFVPGAGLADPVAGKAIFRQKCVACHDVSGATAGSFAELVKRKAPDLHYAGSKFKRAWLVDWLQEPTPIRPSGVMFLNHLAVAEGKDHLKKDAVRPHRPKLDPAAAAAVTDYLMTLTDATMKAGIIDPAKKFSRIRALRLFRKQFPCVGCHKIRSGRKKVLGGVSGPDLVNAGNRLNPDWVYARIEDPRRWDPKTWMPRLEMSHKKRELLTQFLASMK